MGHLEEVTYFQAKLVYSVARQFNIVPGGDMCSYVRPKLDFIILYLLDLDPQTGTKLLADLPIFVFILRLSVNVPIFGEMMPHSQKPHGLVQMGIELGYPNERVQAIFDLLVKKHAKGDISKLGTSHQDEFLDKLLGEEEFGQLSMTSAMRPAPAVSKHTLGTHALCHDQV